MSFNQSKGEKSESHYNKRNSRSGNSGGVQRSFSGSAGGKVGGGNAPPPQSINSSFRKAVEKAVDGQGRVTLSNPNTQANISAGRNWQNGTHVESSLSGFTEAPPPFAASKPTNPPAPKSTRPAPKPPSSQPTNGVSESAAPSTPVKADVTKSFPLQFGSISPGVVNVMQIPPRTSSAPPNLDEQKREQVTHDSLRAPPAIPASPAPKQVHPVKEAGLNKPSTTMEPHVASSQPTRDVHPQIPSTPVGTTISQKPSVLPKHAMSIPMAYQSQVPISFAPNSQLQSQGVPTSLQMPLSMGSATQVQQKIFVPNVQSHPIHPHGMTPQSQNLNFATQIGHQMPPQMSNVGISIPPQFPQQAGNFGSLRKAVKITHPDTHEELRLDKKTDSHKNSGSSGPRSHPNVPPQSQPSPSFTPHQVNYYPPIRPGYNTIYFPAAQTGVPLTGTQMTTGPPAARYAYPVSQSPAAISFKNPSTPKPLPAAKHVPLVQSASEQLIVEYPHHSKAVTGSVSMPPVQVTVNPTVVSLGERVRTSSVTISAPVNKSESPDVPKEGIGTLRQGDREITSGSSNQQSKSVFEPTASRPPSITEKISTAKSADALVQRLPTCTTSSASVLPEESASLVANTEGRQGETVRRMEPSKDRQKKAGRKDAKNTQFHNQDDAPKPAGSSESSSPRMSRNVEQSPSVLSSQDLRHSKSFKDGDSVEGSTTKGTSGGLSVSSEEPSPDVSVSVTDVDFKEPLPDVSQDAKELVNVQLKQESIGTVEERTGVSEGINENSQYSVIPSDSKCSESSEGNKQMEMETDIKETTVTKESSSLVEQKNEESVDLCSSENERTADNLVLSASTSDSVDTEISTSCGSSTSSHDKRTSNTDASTLGIDRASSQDLSSILSATSHQDLHPDSSIVSSHVTLKHESKGVEVTGGSLVSVSGSKDSSTSETNKVKSSTKGKKKMKDILKAADAAGSTSDLYMAYKGPEERQENASASSSENINRSSSVEVKQEPADNTVKNVTVAGEDGQTKAEPDDWEDAAEISTPKLKPSGVGKQALVGSLSQNEDGKMSKKYTRDFLLTLSEQFTDLPAGFEIGSDTAESLMGIPNAGRNVDRANGGPRPDRRGGGIVEDDKWNKGQSHFVPGRDPRFDGGHGGGVVGFRPGQGGTHGVSRNPRGQVGGQYAGGILSGPLQSPGSQVGMQRNNAEADRWQRATGFQKGLIPSPQTPLQIMHKAEKKYEISKVSDIEEAKQRQLKAILNKLTPENFDKLFEQVKEVNIDNAVTLKGVISQIFDKALMEPTFCETYANFCFHLSVELPDFSEDNEKITFKRVLLNKCQEEFERGEREQAEANRVEEEGEVKCSEAEREEKRIQARRRMLGNIRLIGELYKKKMLTEKIMHECIKKLLGQNQTPDEEDIESLCKLMSTIGEMIDHPKAKEHMDAYFDIMTKFSNNMKLSSRVRFMLKDAIDLRKNKWQQRRKVEGPKKIDEVHRDAAQERQAQATRLARGPSVPSSARRGHPLDFGPRGSTVSSSPNSQIGGHRGFPPQVRGYAQDTRVEERHHYESRTLSVPLSQRPLDDNSITLGPQGGLARGMSVRGQSLVSGVPLVDIPPNDPRRYAAGQNGYSAAERTPYPREVSSRYTPERPTGMPAYDQSNLQERNAYLGTRDIRSADRVKDRSVTSSPTSVQDSPTANAWPEERLKDMSISAIREFYSAKDMEEVALCVRDMKSPSFYPSMISIWITDSFERKDLERDLLAKLLVDLTRPQDSLLGQGQLIKGFESVLATLEDTVTDAPKAPDFLGRILAKLIVENVVPLREIGQLIHEGGEEAGRLRQIGLAADVLGSILEMIKLEKGESVLNEMRVSSSLHLEDFRPPAPIKSRRLEAFF